MKAKNEKAKEVSTFVKLASFFKCSSSAAIASTSNVAGPEEDVGLSSPAAAFSGSSAPRPSCSIVPEEATLTEEDTGCQVSEDTTLSTSQAGQAVPRLGREEEEQGEARIVTAEETGGSGTDGLLTCPTCPLRNKCGCKS